MKSIKVGFADTFENCKLFFTEILSRRFEVIRDDGNPDYLIFGDRNFGETHYNYKNCKKIFFTGENVRPIYFTYDYAVTFDHVNSPFHYRLPLYAMEMWATSKEEGPWKDDYLYLVQKPIDPEKEWDKKIGDFSYVQSNPNVKSRNDFYDWVEKSGYRIASGGPHKNNIGRIVTRPGGHKDKIDFISDYRFNIAFENGNYPGYVTEKLLNAFYANTIPIYFGSPLVSRDFNPKAFIDCNGLTFPLVMEKVSDLCGNKNAYCDMLTQPAFCDNIPPSCVNLDNFLNWFEEFVI